MPANTPIRGYPYPVDTDLINVPADMQRLANAVDTVTGTETLRRYTSVAARDSADPVPQEGQRCYCTVGSGTGNGMMFVGRGGEWWALGMCVFHTKSANQLITVDGTWQLITFPVQHHNVGGSYNGSVWTAPFKGYARVSTGATIGLNAAATVVRNANWGYSWQGTVFNGSTLIGSWEQASFQVSTVLTVSPGHQVSSQAWCNATGVTKTVYGGQNNSTGFYIEYV